MKSTPLLMKCPLVRASLAGVKTETRRLITSLNGIGKISHLRPIDPGGYEWAYRNAWGVPCQLPVMPLYDSCPYGAPGDRLWVRETWAEKKGAHVTECYAYKADGICGYPRWNYGEPYFAHHGVLLGYPQHADRMDRFYSMDSFGGKWQPSIFMPREACRLELEILDRSIEHIQDITDEAIRAEGVADLTLNDLLEMGASKKAILAQVATVHPQSPQLGGWTLYDLLGAWLTFPLKERWAILWNLIYGADPSTNWAANPPVWRLKYRKDVSNG